MPRNLLLEEPITQTRKPRNLLADEMVSEQPVKKNVAYLSDVDMTVDYPETMSGDRVNDALQTDIYRRPRFNFYEDIASPLISGGIPAVASKASMRSGKEASKGVLRGVESSLAGVGSLSRWLGENLKASISPVEKSVGEKMVEWGETAFQYWTEQQTSGIEAPDPEVWRGSFVSNPSWTRATALIAQAVPSLATAAAITFATKSPTAGAASLGFLEASGEFQGSMEAGEGLGKSNLIGVSNAFLNTILERVSLSRFLSGGGAVSGAVSEGIPEGLQQISENMIAKIGYDKTRNIMDGVTESLIAGAGSGGLIGGFIANGATKLDQDIENAQNAGVPYKHIQELRQIQSEEVIKNSKEIESLIDSSAKDQTAAVKAMPIKPPTGRGGITPPELEFGQWKDAQSLLLSRETLERNLEGIIKDEKQLTEMKEFIVDPIKDNETARIEWMNNTRELVRQKMADLGIKHNSLEDKLVQRYGEGRITDAELEQETPNYAKVKKASKFFRDQYDEMLDTINTVREKFGYKPIPKRDDYFRHFQELGSWISSFGMILQSNKLPTEIAGMTKFFQPGKPFTNAELRRMGGRFTESAIGGIDNYVDAVSRQIFHTDSVQRARVVEKYIRTAGEEGQATLPNFVANIQEYGNLLAGKKGSVDRAFESLVGRDVYGVATMLQRQVAANIIVGNVSSALSNFIPVTQLASTTKKTAVLRGAVEASYSAFRDNFVEVDGQKSKFLTRRFPKDKLAPTFTEKTANTMMWLFKSIDQFMGKFVVSSKYYEGVEKGLTPSKAMKYADSQAERILADRSVGQLPNLFGNKTLRAWTAFQVEINNQMSFLIKDIPKQYEKDAWKIAGALIQFAIYSFLGNNIYEKVTGRRPQLDLIYAVGTLLGMNKHGEGKQTGERVFQALTDLEGNIPFRTLTSGRNFVDAQKPDVKGIMSGQKTAGEEAIKTALMVINPLGGGAQIRKTVEGLTDYAKGGSFTRKRQDRRYKIEKNFSNLIRAALFGKTSFPEAAEYYAKGGAKGKKRSKK